MSGMKRGLGRGLGALLPEVEASREGGREIELERVRPNSGQPRKHIDPEKLEELAASIREHGVVQPVVVRPSGDGFELVAGERRWRAAKLAGLRTIPAVVRDLSESQVMEIALIENLQREDLNPIEEARAYRRLIEEFGLTQDELARRLGKSRPQIANTLRLLNLHPEVQEQVFRGEVSMGHAKVLLSLESAAVQAELARRVAQRKLSVRETEEAAKALARPRPGGMGRARDGAERSIAAAHSADIAEVEATLRAKLGTPVSIVCGSPKGRIEIAFFGEEDLVRVTDLLLGSVPRQ